jgi:hypothetical protein
MARKTSFFSTLAICGFTCGTILVALPGPGTAAVPLNRAVVQNLRNQVRVLLKGKPVKPAKVQDVLVPGDALATARSSMAELRFNDKSRARVGERAMFRFVPNTRTFRLDNGTVLLLIPPGRGGTNVRTPNASTAIRGSALFVRHDPETTTTTVAALTDSQIEVENLSKSQRYVLKAGQMAVLVGDRIERVFTFDLKTFYETSELVKGLNLNIEQTSDQDDEGVVAVRQETLQALRSQTGFTSSTPTQPANFLLLSQGSRAKLPQLPQSPESTLSPLVSGGVTSPPKPPGPPPVVPPPPQVEPVPPIPLPPPQPEPSPPPGPAPAPPLPPTSGPQPPAVPTSTPPVVPNTPPPTVTQPPQITSPPSIAQPPNPPTSVVQPPAAVVQPPAAVVQPPTAVIQPPAAVVQPPTAVIQPPATIAPAPQLPPTPANPQPTNFSPPPVVPPTPSTTVSPPVISAPNPAPAPQLPGPTSVVVPQSPPVQVTPPTLPSVAVPTVAPPAPSVPAPPAAPAPAVPATPAPPALNPGTVRQAEPALTPQTSVPFDGPKNL